jgi:hypothetical protein
VPSLPYSTVVLQGVKSAILLHRRGNFLLSPWVRTSLSAAGDPQEHAPRRGCVARTAIVLPGISYIASGCKKSQYPSTSLCERRTRTHVHAAFASNPFGLRAPNTPPPTPRTPHKMRARVTRMILSSLSR